MAMSKHFHRSRFARPSSLCFLGFAQKTLRAMRCLKISTERLRRSSILCFLGFAQKTLWAMLLISRNKREEKFFANVHTFTPDALRASFHFIFWCFAPENFAGHAMPEVLHRSRFARSSFLFSGASHQKTCGPCS